MPRKSELFGLTLAIVGALILTPDTLLMRLSHMEGTQMLAWRGLLMGTILLSYSAIVTNRQFLKTVQRLFSLSGLTVICCYFFASVLFTLGIAHSTVIMVLMGVTLMPLFSALFAFFLAGEPTRRSTAFAMIAVFVGVVISIVDRRDNQFLIDGAAFFGVAAGIGVAIAHATSFVVIRNSPQLPIAPAIGFGVVFSGLLALPIAGIDNMGQGQIWPIVVGGALILPISFMLLSAANRHTHSANVSLILLLETVLAPIVVWWGVGEKPTGYMIIGCMVVLASLTAYLYAEIRRT